MGVDVSSFTPVEQTALLSLYARALDSRWPRPILGDFFADELAGQIDYDFEGFGLIASVVCQAALRAKMLDDRVRQFVDTNPHAVVVDLGAGLDDGMLRIEPPPTVEWYSVDFPAVIAVRDRLFPSIAQAQSIGASLMDGHWPERIPADRPTMLIADGLHAFLEERQIIELFSNLTDYFQSGQLAFNDGGHQGWPTRLAVKLAPQKLFKDVSAMKGYAGFNDPHQPERWNPRLELLEETSLTHEPEVAFFPTWVRLGTQLSGHIKTMARKARILSYRF